MYRARDQEIWSWYIPRFEAVPAFRENSPVDIWNEMQWKENIFFLLARQPARSDRQ